MPLVPRTSPPPIGNGYPETLAVLEPGPREVVVVVNDNTRMVHAGMFVGDTLLDPAGSYEYSRHLESGWQGINLQDYLRFQLDDGPSVKLYRFTLAPEQYAQVKERLDAAGRTMPLFCAARVQNIISGIEPFESVPDAWMVFPSTLAGYLDAILSAKRLSGACLWPNGTSCYPSTPGAVLETTME